MSSINVQEKTWADLFSEFLAVWAFLSIAFINQWHTWLDIKFINNNLFPSNFVDMIALFSGNA